MYIICGLGNPGSKYKNTRHNVGFQFIDQLIINYKFKLFKKNKSVEIFKGSIKNKNYYILKPLTYMNLSGIPILSFLNYYKHSLKDLLVVHDDLDLILGKIKFKKGGGNAGHKGLDNIDKTIGNAYNRLRIGIGHPSSKKEVNNYVLDKFSILEKKIIKNIIDISIENIDLLFYKKELFLNKISILKNNINK